MSMMDWHLDPDGEDESQPADNEDLFISALLMWQYRISTEAETEDQR